MGGQEEEKGREGKGGREVVREKEAGAEEVIPTSIPLTAQKAGIENLVVPVLPCAPLPLLERAFPMPTC